MVIWYYNYLFYWYWKSQKFLPKPHIFHFFDRKIQPSPWRVEYQGVVLTVFIGYHNMLRWESQKEVDFRNCPGIFIKSKIDLFLWFSQQHGGDTVVPNKNGGTRLKRHLDIEYSTFHLSFRIQKWLRNWNSSHDGLELDFPIGKIF